MPYQEEVIIKVQADAVEAIKRQQDLRNALESAREEYNRVVEAQGKNSAAAISMEASIKTLNQQIAANGRVLTQMASNTTEVSGAYAALNQKSAEAAQRAKDLSVAYGSNDARTKEAVKSARDLRDQLASVDESVGQGQRSVGLYGEALNKFKGRLDLIPTSFGDLKTGISGAASGFGALGKQMWALVTIPIVAIIAAIASALFGLYSIFKDFKPVVDAVEQALAALGAVFETVKNTIVGLFTSTESASDSFINLGANMANAAKEAIELKKAQQELEDSQAGLEVQNKRAETQIQKLMLMSRNRTLTEQQRIDMLSKSQEIEEDIFKRNKSMNDEEVKIAENKIITGKNLSEWEIKRLRNEGVSYARLLQDKKNISDEEIENLKTALLKREDINQASIGLQEKAQNRIDALEEKKRAAAEKSQQEAEKRAEAARSAAEKREQKRLAAIQKEQESEKALKDFKLKTLKENADADIAAVQDEAKLIKLKNEERLAGQKLTDAQIHAQKVSDANDAANAELSILDAKLLNEQITQEEYNKQSILIAQQRNTDLAIIDAEYEDVKRQNRIAAAAVDLENELAIAENKGQMLFDLQIQQNEAKRLQEVADAEKIGADVTLVNQKYAAIQTQIELKKKEAILGMASDAMGNFATIAGKNTKVGKMAASAQTAIDTYKGAISAYSSLAGIPIVGPALGAVAAGAAVASGLKAIKDIWAVKSGLPGDGGGGGSAVSLSTATVPAAVTGGLVARSSGQTQVQGTQQAVSNALEQNPQQPVLVVQDVTQAQGNVVKLKNDNSL